VREQTLAFDRAVNSDRSLWRSRYQPRRTAGDLPYRTTDWYMDQAGGDRAKAVALMKDAGLLDSGGHRVSIQSASDRGRKLADGTPPGRITESRIKRLPPDARGGGGGGSPGTGGMSGGPDEPRVLPKMSHHSELPRPGSLPATLLSGDLPPSARDLRDAGVVGSAWEHMSATERRTAGWLHDHGLRLVSVRARPRGRTPDAIALDFEATVEIKGLKSSSSNALRQRLRAARRQSRRIVIDARDVALTESRALEVVASELHRRGGDYGEILIMFRDGSTVSWP